MPKHAGTPIVVCPECGKSNRVPVARLGDGPRCGSCQTPLPAPDSLVHLDDDTFDAVVSGARRPVVVDFSAAWCGPCRVFEPVLEELAEEAGGRVLVGKVDVDHAPEAAAHARVQAVPTVVVYRHGREVARRTGVQPLASLRRLAGV